MDNAHNSDVSSDEIIEFVERFIDKELDEHRKQIIEELHSRAGIPCYLIMSRGVYASNTSLALKKRLMIKGKSASMQKEFYTIMDVE